VLLTRPYISLDHLADLKETENVSKTQRDRELARFLELSAQVVAVVGKVLGLDLIAELVVDLSLECKDVLAKVHVHDLGL